MQRRIVHLLPHQLSQTVHHQRAAQRQPRQVAAARPPALEAAVDQAVSFRNLAANRSSSPAGPPRPR